MLPFIDSRAVRARWAKFTILFTGLFGMANAGVFLMLHSGWLVASPHAKYILNTWLPSAGGIILGVTLALILSGHCSPADAMTKKIQIRTLSSILNLDFALGGEQSWRDLRTGGYEASSEIVHYADFYPG